MTVGSPDPETLHRGELDLLFTDLVQAGFRPRSDDRRHWVGPIRESLRKLTRADQIRIEIRDGWPYQHPYIHVDGLGTRKHVNQAGNTCLWFEDDNDYGQWLRLDTILARIDAWVADQEAGPAEPALDAHLYFPGRVPGLLMLDLGNLLERGQITARAGASGELRVQGSGPTYALGDRGSFSAGWFWQQGIVAPPTTPDALRHVLSAGQRRLYDRLTTSISRSQPAFMLLLWDDHGEVNALGLRVERRTPGHYALAAMEVARVDPAVMRLRAGPDVALLRDCGVAVFGVGAIGSEAAVLLARSGLGTLTLVDGELLRPANLTRHTASGRFVGLPKVKALAETIAEARLPTRVDTVEAMLWQPSLVRGVVERTHLVVDTTGNAAYTDMLSRLCVDGRRPLVASALHRGGRILRIRVQMAETKAPIWHRSGSNGFPDVPADPAPKAQQTWEVGCGAPINNASPVSVTGAGSRTARAVVDVLAGRVDRDLDMFEIYEGIEDARFAEPGALVIETRA